MVGVSIEFISVEQVQELHEQSILAYGGAPGVRDYGLLESAISQPMATFGQQFLHAFPFEMAAAYLFHLAGNHPFVDGNKRTATATAIASLYVNGYQLLVQQEELERMVVATASGQLDKAAIAEFFRANCQAI